MKWPSTIVIHIPVNTLMVLDNTDSGIDEVIHGATRQGTYIHGTGGAAWI